MRSETSWSLFGGTHRQRFHLRIGQRLSLPLQTRGGYCRAQSPPGPPGTTPPLFILELTCLENSRCYLGGDSALSVCGSEDFSSWSGVARGAPRFLTVQFFLFSTHSACRSLRPISSCFGSARTSRASACLWVSARKDSFRSRGCPAGRDVSSRGILCVVWPRCLQFWLSGD